MFSFVISKNSMKRIGYNDHGFIGICGGKRDKKGFEMKSLKLWKISLCYYSCG